MAAERANHARWFPLMPFNPGIGIAPPTSNWRHRLALLLILLLLPVRARAGGGQLGAPGDLYVSASNRIVEFDGETGAFVGNFVQPGSGGLDEANGLVFGPNGNLFVANRMQFLDTSDQILEFDGQTGAFIRALVPTGGAQNTGWLDSAQHLLFRPDGRLLVASGDSESILAYDAAAVLNTPGASAPWLGVFAIGGPAPSLRYPYTIRPLPNGNVIVTSAYGGQWTDNHIIEYHGATGRLVRHFTDPFGMPYPVDILARANGNLLVSYYYNGVYQFEDATGSFLGIFTQPGAQTVYAGMTLGPNGNLFVAGRNGINIQTIIQYSGATGALVGTFVALPYTVLPSPHYLAFKPAPPDPTPAPSISSVSVTSHDACLPLAGVVIAGANLSQPDTTVMLRKSDEIAGYLGVVTGADSTSLTVNFDLDHGMIATGAWDLVLMHPDGQSATLPGAIHITGCRAAHTRNLLSTAWRHRGLHTVSGIMEYSGQSGDALGWVTQDQAESTLGELWLAPGMTVGPGGDLFVATGEAAPDAGDGAQAIVRYDGITGERLGVFVPAETAGMQSPRDVVYGPDGRLLVLHRLEQGPTPSGILAFDGLSGAFVAELVPLGGCGLFDAEKVALCDGKLFVACSYIGVIEIDATTGSCLGMLRSRR
ncbi:MAG TPA: hypothetical protein VGM03_05730 [Phycisphaerae bacterium]|jgi:DNA-binding beta-propeller fold protein YncE